LKFVAICFVFTVLCIQNIGHTQTTIFGRKIAIEHGLISNDNYRVTSDSKGAVWVCSERGVVCFYGNKTKRFTISNGLLNNDVWNLSVDSKDRIWLSDFGHGMQYIENDEVKTIEESLGFKRLIYSGEHQDTVFFCDQDYVNNRRYYFANGKFGYYNPFNFKGLEVKLDLREFGFVVLSKTDSDDNIDFIFNVKTKKLNKLEYPVETLSKDDLNDGNRLFWINGKVVKPTKGGFVPTKIYLPENRITCIISKNYLVAITPNSYQLFSIERESRDYKLEAIIHNNLEQPINLISLCEDKEGNIWTVEERGNVYFFHENARWAKHVPLHDYVKSYRVNWAKYQPNDLENLIFYDNKSQGHNLNIKSNSFQKIISRDDIRQIEVIGNRLLVISVELEIYSIKYVGNDIRLKLEGKFDLPAYKLSLCLHKISNDSVIIGNGILVTGFSTRNTKLSEIWNNQLPKRINSITYSDSLIGYATFDEVGIYNLRNNQKTVFNIKNPSTIKFIDDYIVLGTDGLGIYYRHKQGLGRFKHLNFSYKVNDIVHIKNQLFFCTDFGLFRGKIDSKGVLKIDRAFFNQKSVGLDVRNVFLKNDKYYLLSNQGLVIIDSKLNTSNAFTRYAAQYYSVTSHNDNIISHKNPVIPYENHYIQFMFSDNSQFDIAKTAFRYKLVGHTDLWVYSSDSEVEFLNLKPGNYCFIIESAQNENLHYGNRKVFRFSIDKPYYLKLNFLIPFVLIFILVLIALFYFGKFISERRTRKKWELKTLELKALRAQLNPHFIFNSLNSIQSTLILKGQLQANEFIVEFADLMRKVLNNSRNEKISLREEIEFITTYLSLENRRQKNKFVYEISIDEAINVNTTMVYVMIFQPIIENAIVHGFMSAQKDKKLEISFKKDNEFLIASIYDNGIGIKKSVELNKNKLHRSLASTILKEKMEVVNALKSNELDLYFVELTDDVPGTKIIIRMRI